MLLVLLAQFSGCASFFCSLAPEDELAPRRLSIAIPSVEEVAPLSEDDVVVAALTHPTAMEITRIRNNEEERIASTPPLSPYDLTQSVFPTERGWWFSRQGVEGVVSSVFFVVSDGAIQQTRVNLSRQDPVVWMPVQGDEPRGVQVSVANEQPALLMDEVTPSGVKRIGVFPWWETGSKRAVIDSRWSAEALGDGRIAVVAVDGPPGAMTLRLRVLGGAEAVESTLPCTAAIDFPIATAVDEHGRLAIAGLSEKGQVVAMIVDVDRPESARCRVVSASGERAARPPFGTPAVVQVGAGFIAGWIRDDGVVRTCELGDLRFPPLVIDVGEGAEVDHPLRQLIYSNAEHVTFVWKQRGGEVVVRRLPHNVTGFAVATEIWRLLCTRFQEAKAFASAG